MTLFADSPANHVLVFDSGVGGLSVSAEIRKRLPSLHQSYLADDAFRPYGEKTESQIRSRLPGLLRTVCFMLKPDIVVVACNTASTTALPAIRAALEIPVVGVVPAIKPASAVTRTGTIAVLGTPGTIRRDYVGTLIERFADDCDVRLHGSLGLVSQAEAKLSGDRVDLDIIRAEIAPVFEGRAGADVDAVVLACTHFPLLVDEMRSVVRQSVRWIDSGEAIARRVESLLSNVEPRHAPPRDPVAFTTGRDIGSARRRTFGEYGFSRLIPLMQEGDV